MSRSSTTRISAATRAGQLPASAERLALNLSDIAWTGAARFEPGKEYHSLNGNPDRFRDGPVDIVTRSASRVDLSLRDRVASTVLGNLAGAIFPADRGASANGHISTID